MNIFINGKQTDIAELTTVEQLLCEKGFSCVRAIVEYNGTIIPGDKWLLVTLKENDRLEVLSFVGGG